MASIARRHRRPINFRLGICEELFGVCRNAPTRGVLEDLPRLKEVTDLSDFGFHLTSNS